MALTVTKLVAQLSIVGGTSYFTLQQGVWGNSEEGTKAFQRLVGTVAPSVSDSTISSKIPSKQEMNESFKENWNSGVKTVFDSAGKLPDYAKQLPSTVSKLVNGPE